MWMFWNPVATRSFITYSENSQATKDRLAVLHQEQEDQDDHRQQQARATNRSELLCHLRKIEGGPWRVKFQQNTLCDYCRNFLLHLLAENSRLGEMTDKQSSTSNSSSRLIYCKPRARSIYAAIKSMLLQNCWICAHMVRNVWRDGKGVTKTQLTSLYAFDFSPDEFSLATWGNKAEQLFMTSFQISPMEVGPASQTPHQIFDVMERGAQNLFSPGEALAVMLDLEDSGIPSTFLWSSDGLEKALCWLEVCEKEHTGCSGIDGDVPTAAYPSRILDLSKSDSGVLQLVGGDTLQSEGAKYATLSHCWGDVRQALLLKANLKAYSQEISISRLPRTFSDAIKVCNDLKIRYLWIDSLCIIQDDKEDWAAEAPRMAEVYTNSHITLAATASHSDADGLFNPLDPALISPLIFHVGTGDNENGQCFGVQKEENFQSYVNNAPLNRRAWVLQERALSRRILHFANDQLYWQCASEVQAQFDLRFDPKDKFMSGDWQYMMRWDGSTFGRNFGTQVHNVQSDQERFVFSRGQPTDPPLLTKWDDLVQIYSQCELTYTSDKLIAIAGLARRIQTLTSWQESDYLAGLWRQGLPRRLLWTCYDPSPKPSNAEVPSWSWAHVNNLIAWPAVIWTENEECTGKIVAELLSASTSPIQSALGSVNGGQLILRAQLCRLKLHRSLLAEYYIAAKVLHHDKWISISGVTESLPLDVNFDLKTSWTEIFGRTVFFMPILDKTSTSRDEEGRVEEGKHTLYGLMLEPTGSKNGQYRRVGFLGVEAGAYEIVRKALLASRLSERHFSGMDDACRYVLEIT